MACDRFIYWNDDQRPTKDEIGKILEDYFGAFATEIRWNQDRFVVSLVGDGTSMFNRVSGAYRVPNGSRWIEVWMEKGSLDVITRLADNATSALADELARRLARFYCGRLDMERD
jgi:hypothetical protein